MKIRKINKKYVFKRDRCDEFLHTKPMLKNSDLEKTVTKEHGLKDHVVYYSIKTCAKDFGK